MVEEDLQQLSLFGDEDVKSPVVWPMIPLTEIPQIVQLELPFEWDDKSVE